MELSPFKAADTQRRSRAMVLALWHKLYLAAWSSRQLMVLEYCTAYLQQIICRSSTAGMFASAHHPAVL